MVTKVKSLFGNSPQELADEINKFNEFNDVFSTQIFKVEDYWVSFVYYNSTIRGQSSLQNKKATLGEDSHQLTSPEVFIQAPRTTREVFTPATPKKIRALELAGFKPDKIKEISKEEAFQLIKTYEENLEEGII